MLFRFLDKIAEKLRVVYFGQFKGEHGIAMDGFWIARIQFLENCQDCL